MIEPLAYGYLSESVQRELSNEYQHDRVKMVFKNLCVLWLWTKVATALEELGKAKCLKLLVRKRKIFRLRIEIDFKIMREGEVVY